MEKKKIIVINILALVLEINLIIQQIVLPERMSALETFWWITDFLLLIALAFSEVVLKKKYHTEYKKFQKKLVIDILLITGIFILASWLGIASTNKQQKEIVIIITSVLIVIENILRIKAWREYYGIKYNSEIDIRNITKERKVCTEEELFQLMKSTLISVFVVQRILVIVSCILSIRYIYYGTNLIAYLVCLAIYGINVIMLFSKRNDAKIKFCKTTILSIIIISVCYIAVTTIMLLSQNYQNKEIIVAIVFLLFMVCLLINIFVLSAPISKQFKAMQSYQLDQEEKQKEICSNEVSNVYSEYEQAPTTGDGSTNEELSTDESLFQTNNQVKK